MIFRIFAPPLPGMDRMRLEIERALTYVAGRASDAATVTADTTLAAANGTALVDATSGDVVISLPAAATVTGRIYTVKKIDASANTATIDADGSETIDGDATKVISTQWASLTIQSDGTAWFVL